MASTNADKPKRAKISRYYDLWANIPSASAAPGAIVMVGEYNNTEWQSDGTYWRPRGGRQRIHAPTLSFSTTGTTSEVAAWTPVIPAGMLFPGCQIETGATITKSGTAGTTTPRTRYNGAAGTIIGQNLAATGSYVGCVITSRLVSGGESGGNITLTNANASNAGQGSGFTTTAKTTVTHAMANQVTMNMTLQCSSAADTLTMQSAFVEICG